MKRNKLSYIKNIISIILILIGALSITLSEALIIANIGKRNIPNEDVLTNIVKVTGGNIYTNSNSEYIIQSSSQLITISYYDDTQSAKEYIKSYDKMVNAQSEFMEIYKKSEFNTAIIYIKSLNADSGTLIERIGNSTISISISNSNKEEVNNIIKILNR